MTNNTLNNVSEVPIVFTRFQLVEFGNYLLSEERRKSYQQEGDQSILQERLSAVNHADVENYIESLNNESKTIGY